LIKRSSSALLKFDTPMAFALPLFMVFSIALYVSM
jgi:hypothetical protein